MPAHALAQPERQLGTVLAPRPLRREVGQDRLHCVLRHMLVEQDQIVEDRHHRRNGRDCHFLECGHARRAVAMGDMEHAARLLGERASRPGYGDQQRTRRRCGTKLERHVSCLPLIAAHDFSRYRAALSIEPDVFHEHDGLVRCPPCEWNFWHQIACTATTSADPLRFRGLRPGSRMSPWGLLLLWDMAKYGGMGNGSGSAEGTEADRTRVGRTA